VLSAQRAALATRVGVALTRVSGLLAAALGCAFLLQGLSRSRLPVADSLISELEARDQPDSALFRVASLLAGLLTVVLAAGLRRRLPPGALGAGGCAALALSGLGGIADALLPLDCAPSVDVVCRSKEQHGALSWPHQMHTWSSVLGAATLLASLWLLGRHVRAVPGWRRLSRLGTVGGTALIAYSGVVTLMAAYYLPGVGLAQRLQELAFSASLVVLALCPASGPG
jgi:Protein of unknown function (DUF998)